ncbi:MAG: chromate transporter [Synergistaceae bacterium]|nr:chromate transporter [Synergistaceae bacterium]
MIYLKLFWEFFNTGLFAVGGGMATLPFLYDIADRTAWFSRQQLADMIAVSESTPGPIGINMATYSGYLTAGIPGSIIATLGLITPSIIVILLIAAFLNAFHDNKFVNGAFYGLRPASCAMITAAGFVVAHVTFINDNFRALSSWDRIEWPALGLAVFLIVFTNFVKPTKKLHPVFWIFLAAIVGIVFKF